MNHKVSVYLANKLIDIGCDNYDNRVAKVCYAIENIIDDIEKYLVLFVFFTFIGELDEFIKCLIVVMLIRKNLGGIHLRTSWGCTIFSCLVFFISIFGGHYIRFSIIEIYVLLFIIVILILLFAPLPSRNRPLYKKNLKRKFKVQGIIGVCITLLICNLGKYDSVGVMLLIQIAEVLISKIKLRI